MKSTVVQELIEKTYRELAQADKPRERSRVATATNGYIFLVSWSNANLLRVLVRKFSATLPKSEYRTKTHLNDAARSTVANIEEGFRRPTTSEYLNFLGFSQASLIEIKGDVQRCRQDGFLRNIPGSSLAGLKINLKDWHEALEKTVISNPNYRNLEESKGTYNSPLNFFKFLYDPVDNLQAIRLTYEIYIELINKTDWHLRRLVESLEDKLNQEQKYYQVEQARIKSKLRLKP